MGRKEPAQGKHTSPQKAGEQNMVNYNGRPEDDEFIDTSKAISDLFNISLEKSKQYKGLWTEEDLEREISSFFQYCEEHKIKPAKAGLRLWLGCDKSTYHDWENNPSKYGYKSDLIKEANDIMEMQMVSRIEKYPTGNIFLLKTSHGHVEASRLDITSNGQTVNSADEVRDLVSKLGLDKKE